jgi:hypothetical protein
LGDDLPADDAQEHAQSPWGVIPTCAAASFANVLPVQVERPRRAKLTGKTAVGFHPISETMKLTDNAASYV